MLPDAQYKDMTLKYDPHVLVIWTTQNVSRSWQCFKQNNYVSKITIWIANRNRSVIIIMRNMISFSLHLGTPMEGGQFWVPNISSSTRPVFGEFGNLFEYSNYPAWRKQHASTSIRAKTQWSKSKISCP